METALISEPQRQTTLLKQRGRTALNPTESITLKPLNKQESNGQVQWSGNGWMDIKDFRQNVLAQLQGRNLNLPEAEEAKIADSEVKREEAMRAELGDAAKGFEGFMLYQLYESMRKTVDKNPMFHGGSAEDTFGQMLSMEQTKQIAESDKPGVSLGIADIIEQGFARAGAGLAINVGASARDRAERDAQLTASQATKPQSGQANDAKQFSYGVSPRQIAPELAHGMTRNLRQLEDAEQVREGWDSGFNTGEDAERRESQERLTRLDEGMRKLKQMQAYSGNSVNFVDTPAWAVK